MRAARALANVGVRLLLGLPWRARKRQLFPFRFTFTSRYLIKLIVRVYRGPDTHSHKVFDSSEHPVDEVRAAPHDSAQKTISVVVVLRCWQCKEGQCPQEMDQWPAV